MIAGKVDTPLAFPIHGARCQASPPLLLSLIPWTRRLSSANASVIVVVFFGIIFLRQRLRCCCRYIRRSVYSSSSNNASVVFAESLRPSSSANSAVIVVNFLRPKTHRCLCHLRSSLRRVVSYTSSANASVVVVESL